jgi:hypothetical protein
MDRILFVVQFNICLFGIERFEKMYTAFRFRFEANNPKCKSCLLNLYASPLVLLYNTGPMIYIYMCVCVCVCVCIYIYTSTVYIYFLNLCASK